MRGCFAWNDVENLVFIEGNVPCEMHRNILEGKLFQSSKKLQLGCGMVFQHDDDWKHTAHIVKHWLDENHVEHLPWPLFSIPENILGKNSNVE